MDLRLDAGRHLPTAESAVFFPTVSSAGIASNAHLDSTAPISGSGKAPAEPTSNPAISFDSPAISGFGGRPHPP
jgi:hypothetical protein